MSFTRNRWLLLTAAISASILIYTSLPVFERPKKIVAQCTDCSAAPVVLSKRAVDELYRICSGLGSVSPTNGRDIPYAVFDCDGIIVYWTDDGLRRHDYPVQGFSTLWKFTLGDLVVATAQGSSNEQLLITLVNELRK